MQFGTLHPVSSGKYSGTFVFAGPVAEPTVMLFTVPLNGCTIIATATFVTSCSSSADYPDSLDPMSCGGVFVAMSCGGGCFTPDGAYDSVWDRCEADEGNYIFNYFQYQDAVGCLAMSCGGEIFLSLWCVRLCMGQRIADEG